MGQTMRLLLALLVALLAGCDGSGPSTVRVMSFNIRYDNTADGLNQWSERREAVVQVVRAFTPDLLGTQECLAHQGTFLRQALPEYTFVGVGRDDGREQGEMTAIFFRTDRFDLLESGHFWLSESPQRPGSRSWDAAITRMVSWAQLRDRRDATTLWFFNTHFDHRGELARLNSAMLLRRRVLEMSGGARAIIAGDFNAPSDGAVARALRRGDGVGVTLLDTYREAHPQPRADEGTFTGFGESSSGPRIDWIVVTPDIGVIDAGIDRTATAGRWPSDHFPVTATLRFGSSE